MTVCGFCKGKPVRNAAAWVSLDASKYAPCPRCGLEWDADALAEYELRDELAIKAEHEVDS
jgi:predicted  nucleic acid-binding Zn ribbon protein